MCYNKRPVAGVLLALIVSPAATVLGGPPADKGPAVALVRASGSAFQLRTGAYVVDYAPREGPREEGWITIRRQGREGPSIATKLANGPALDVTDAGGGEADIYKWAQPRKDAIVFRTLAAHDDAQQVEVTIESERNWARFDSRFIAYKRFPGLMRWTVTATAKADKAFSGDPEPDCRFMNGGKVTGKANYQPHEAVRYAVQRGPSSGIAYFHDLTMDSLVFYFQDYTSLNDLYRLTGCDNPYNYPAEGNPGAVRLGQVRHDFQLATPDGTNLQPPRPWHAEPQQYQQFGYYRPGSFRVPAGKTLVLADTYLYLAPDAPPDNMAVCRQFVEMLADVYGLIKKPTTVTTDWAGDVVPRLIRDVLREPNGSRFQGKYYIPRAYVDFEVADVELWNLLQLLIPLTDYTRKHPEQKDAAELRRRLEETLPVFHDAKYQGFLNDPAPFDSKRFFHSVYLFEPTVMMADLAQAGNAKAREMLLGFRPRLLEMGRCCGYVFADVWLDDFSKQKGYYQFDETGAYIYIMTAINDLNGGKDAACLAAARAAAGKLADRCLDLMWEINLTAAGVAGCERLYRATGDARFRDLAWLPLANTLRWAWLWECDYGMGEHVTTFWGFCGTPGAPSSPEFESHRTRFHLKQYEELAASHLPDRVRTMLHDSWTMGQTQSRSALPPYIVQAGGARYLAREGTSETNCGAIRHDQMIPLEDFKVGWGTDVEWWHNNPKLGIIGQEIYGAGGPIWYAVLQDERQ